MNKTLPIAGLIFIMIFIFACTGGTPPQTPPEVATPTQAAPQPTNPPAPADTATPVPTNTAPASTDTPAAAANVSFANDVMPIFNEYCVKCHGVEQIKEGLDLRTYDTLMQGSFNGPVVVPGNAADSYMIQLLNEGKMPKRGPKPSPEQVQIIADWINQGAANN